MTEAEADKTIIHPDEFAAAMQQLSAEAEKALPGFPVGREKLIAEETPAGTVSHAIAEELRALETRLMGRVEQLVTAMETTRAEQFKRIDEQVTAIRCSESVNQQLFDSMHSELRNYRDNFLHESLQKPFIHDLVLLYDDLSALAEQLRSAAQEKNGKRHIIQWRDNLENTIHMLVEILHRFEVHEIEAKERIDRSMHKVISFEPADFPEEDGCIVMRVKRGFMWRGKLVRPEEVIAKRFG
jgi:molecular chaperone GrpE (heat shock protein)